DQARLCRVHDDPDLPVSHLGRGAAIRGYGVTPLNLRDFSVRSPHLPERLLALVEHSFRSAVRMHLEVAGAFRVANDLDHLRRAESWHRVIARKEPLRDVSDRFLLPGVQAVNRKPEARD